MTDVLGAHCYRKACSSLRGGRVPMTMCEGDGPSEQQRWQIAVSISRAGSMSDSIPLYLEHPENNLAHCQHSIKKLTGRWITRATQQARFGGNE